jgi:hypothetical protein
LGHATRCIPIIQGLLNANFEPIIASDGDALVLLQKEFPSLKRYKLPSYNIKYSKSSFHLKWKLLFSIPSVISAVKKEQKLVAEIVKNEGVSGIISDNRFGVYNATIPSVYITHQLNVLSGNTTWITSKVHQKISLKFDECWIPDVENEPNLSGNLGHLKNNKFNIKYIGILSRLKFQKTAIKYDLMVLLSGPEPQRTLLENKLLKELKNYKGTVLFVRGIFSTNEILISKENLKFENFLLSEDLETAIQQSDLVLARSGYSTIMDLAVLEKKAFFIPTPGQFEQEYLAKILQIKRIAPFSKQKYFSIEKLHEIKNYTGFLPEFKTSLDLKLFYLFNSK